MNQATKFQSVDSVLIEKAGWALRQRLRKQMNQLSGSFFDEVDDFVFEAGKQGQLKEGSDYLGAMREIRAKQVMFEETFLDSASNNMEGGSVLFADAIASSSENLDSPVIFESMEIELAIGTMARKANKFYSPYVKQLESLISTIDAKKAQHLVRGNTIVSSVLLGFVEAQGVIKIELELRLVFMKISEQHFIMKMEKLFLDSISILNNIDNKQFADRLYSSSSSFHVPVASSCTPSKVTEHNIERGFQPIKADSKAVESSVSDALEVLRSNEDVPGFVQKMAEEHWRMVMLLIGLNKGVSSLEWQEAEHVLQLLVLCSAGQIASNQFDQSLLIDKLGQGLRLLRISNAGQDGFLAELKEHLSMRADSLGDSIHQHAGDSSLRIQPEATVSPSGENVINAEDLDEIAQLINGESVAPDTAESEDMAQLHDCLSSVDAMSSCCSVQMSIKGKLHDCIVTKSGPAGDVYVITNAGAAASSRKIAVTRSRLGLAISLRRGEMLLAEETAKPAACKITVFERRSQV